MAKFVSLDNSIPEVGSSSGAERMTRSRARRNRKERAATREAHTLAMSTARARQSQRERAATREAATLARRTARDTQSQGERVATRKANTLARRTARARQPQQQAFTRDWSRLPVLNRPNPPALNLGLLLFQCTSDVQAK